MHLSLRRASLLASLSLAAGVLAFGAACGDDDDGSSGATLGSNSGSTSSGGSQSLDKWVTTVCDAAKACKARTDKLSTELEKVDLDKDPKGGKTILLDVYARGQTAQNDAIKAVNKAGTPDIKGGGDVKKALDSALQTNKKALDGVIAKIKAADPKSADFADKVDQAFTEAETDHLRADLEKIAAKQPAAQDVIDGFEADEECASVVFSGDSAARPLHGTGSTLVAALAVH